MSPRRSESVRRLAAIEALVCRDVGRKTGELIAASAGELATAAESLAGATSVGLITGFFVPRAAVAAPETDGPVGTALLAAALAACGVPARIAVDTPCAGAVRAAVEEAGGGVAVDEVGVDDRMGLDRLIGTWREIRRQPCRRHRALRPQWRWPAAQHARRRCLAVDRAARRSVPGRTLDEARRGRRRQRDRHGSAARRADCAHRSQRSGDRLRDALRSSRRRRRVQLGCLWVDGGACRAAPRAGAARSPNS